MKSEATAHMTYKKKHFSTFVKKCDAYRVVDGNNCNLAVEGKATIKIQKLINGNQYDGAVNNVYIYLRMTKESVFRRNLNRYEITQP